MTHSYEVAVREEGQPHVGHACLLVDGVDAHVSVNPAQWAAAVLAEQLLAGKTPEQAALAVEAECMARATRSLLMRADRLRRGRLAQGHGMFGAEGSEEQAVAAYMQRGRLAGLDAKASGELLKRRGQKYDNDRDWADRRAKLIDECAAEIKRWEELARQGNKKADRMLLILRERLKGLQPRVVAVIHGFQYAYTQYWSAAINLATDDIRIWPYMTNTTIDTVRDAVDTFSDVTLDEFDGANYSSGGLALDSQTVAVDDANDRAEFDCADEAVTALGAGTRSMQGVAVGKFVTNTAASLPLHVIDFSSNKNPDGSDFTFVINAEGLLQMADG